MIAYRIDLYSYIHQDDSNAPQEDCRRVGEALEANSCLREFHLKTWSGNCYPSLSIIIEHLCRNETLNEVTINLRGKYEGELQLCVSSIQYFTCLHLEQRTMQRKHPPPTECYPSWIIPFHYCFTYQACVSHCMYSFIDAPGLFNQALWYPLTPLQYF